MAVERNVSKAQSRCGPELIGWLLDRHAAALELYARQLCDCPEDVVQEALIQLSRQRAVPREVLPWLFRVVRNGALSASRSSRRRRQHEASAAAAGDQFFRSHPEDAIDAQLAEAELTRLPTDQREVIVARLWGGLTFEQIGRLVGVTDSTAHRRYQAGLLQLRQKLGVSCLNKTTTKN